MSLRDFETRIADNKQEIQKIRDQSYILGINVGFDYVVLNFLKEKLGFNYEAEKAKISKVLMENTAKIEQLLKENENLQKQIFDASYTEKIAAAKITFQGEYLKSFSGDAITISCPRCQTEFTKNLRNVRTLTNEPNLDYLLNARSIDEFQKFIKDDYNKFKVDCPNCGLTAIIYANRFF